MKIKTIYLYIFLILNLINNSIPHNIQMNYTFTLSVPRPLIYLSFWYSKALERSRLNEISLYILSALWHKVCIFFNSLAYLTHINDNNGFHWETVVMLSGKSKKYYLSGKTFTSLIIGDTIHPVAWCLLAAKLHIPVSQFIEQFL